MRFSTNTQGPYRNPQTTTSFAHHLSPTITGETICATSSHLKKRGAQVWVEETRRVFGSEQQHLVFSWDSEEKGKIDAFLEHGFRYVQLLAMTLRSENRQVAQSCSENIVFRNITKDWEWEAVIQLQIRTGLENEPDDPMKMEAFQRQKFDAYRKLQRKGMGQWWGAFDAGVLVADLGLFFDFERGLGRFQSVETAKEHRRKGLCSALLQHSLLWAKHEHSVRMLVIVAEKDSEAEHLYRSLGFEGKDINHGVWKIHPE